MAARHAFSIDLDRCIGCQACAAACSTGNDVPTGESYIAVWDVVRPRAGALWGSFAHRRCFHCAAAPCVAVCPTGALSKRDGLTAVAPEKCSGCGYCAEACPFGVPRVRDDQVWKCVGCLEQVEAGQAPWCERTCPSQAIHFGEREAILAEARGRVEALRPRHPDARLYGESQLGGLGLLMVLLDRADVYGLPERPQAPPAIQVWKEKVQPAVAGLSTLAGVGMGLLFVVSRRRRLREEAAARAAGEAPSGAGDEDPSGGGAP